MAKVWKPKYWDAKNPPDVGSRVFVGGANGSGHYETINAGETKRILQSNGQGNIFYGNVMVDYPPLEPALESNLPVGDYSTIIDYTSRITPSVASGATLSSTMVFKQSEAINFRKNNILLDNASTSLPSVIMVGKPYSIEILKTQCNKLTLYVDASNYCIFEFSYTSNTDTSNATQIRYNAVVKAIMLNGSLNTNASTLSRTWSDFTDKYIYEIPAQLIFSKTQW